MSGDFKLSATLRGHEEDVRQVTFPNRHTLYSASRDNTVRRWTLTSPSPPIYDDTIALQGAHWFNGLAYAPPSSAQPEGLFAAGGRETFVFVKHEAASPDADPHRLLIGHAGNITCLAFNGDGSKIVSGGWDSQAFVWDVEGGNVVAELKGHGGPVWGVLVFDEKLVLTACADKKIRVFDLNGKSLKTIQGHTDVVRCFCKVEPEKWSGATFASAGNDDVIRLWTIDGTAVAELEGHTAYVYSLASLPNGDIVSSSEDRTVRVWRSGQCIQTITHPAISIWTVAACPETGDIVSGASDKTIRIFSRDPERQASVEDVRQFEESNRMYAIPAETATQGQPFEKENLPGPEALQTQQGQRDGQQLFIRENDGSVTAHLWSASTAQWNLIGTVVAGQGSGSQKKTHNGKEYDFVFDVDIKDGEPPLKLPYNLSESSWDAARRFLDQNELPMSYYEQVANWITENTRGARIGTDSTSSVTGSAPQARDPWGSDSRYRPGDAGSNTSSSERKIPQRSYVEVLEGNAQNAVTKINESSKQLLDEGKIVSAASISTDEQQALQALVQQLNSSPKEPRPTDTQIQTLLKASTQWPTASRVPAIAILARLAVSPTFISKTSAGPQTVIDTFFSSGLLTPAQSTANNAVHALRLLANIFATSEGRLIASGTLEQMLTLVRPFASNPESTAQAKALATIYLNASVLLAADAPASSTPSPRHASAKKLLIDVATLLESESPYLSPTSDAESEALFRALAALGTLLSLGKEFRDEVKGGVAGTLHFVSAKVGSDAAGERIKGLMKEVRDELR